MLGFKRREEKKPEAGISINLTQSCLFTSELPIRSIRNPSNREINEQNHGAERTTKAIGGLSPYRLGIG